MQLKRKTITEEQFDKANEAAGSHKADLEKRREELTRLLSKARASESVIEGVPKAVKTFVKGFQGLEPRQQKRGPRRSKNEFSTLAINGVLTL